MRNEEKFVPLFARLSDRFGDHGLISVVILHLDKAELEIRDWLMSCRVLARGVEQYLMARVAGVARDKGLPRMTGRYIPTAKNAMVKNFYLQFGFEKTGEEGGVSQWRIETAAFTPAKTFITESAGAS
jgi:FkbH-like protein